MCVYTHVYIHTLTHIYAVTFYPRISWTLCVMCWEYTDDWGTGRGFKELIPSAETKAFVWLTLIRAVLGNVSSSRHLLSALISRSSARQPGAWRWPRHGSSGSWQNVGGRCLLCQNPGRSLQKSHCRWWGYQQLSLGAPAQPDSEELEGWKPPCRV